MEKFSYEEYLDKNGTFTYRFRGVSMNPLLKQGRDLFTVKKKTDERCKKYDVVLYRRPPNQYVLHRIIKVRDNDYVILGDNCIQKEYGTTDSDIIGVMTHFSRKGKTYSVDNKLYKLYYHIWCRFHFARVLKFKLRCRLSSLKHKIKNR